MNIECPYCNSGNIERVSNSDITICYECHKWCYNEDIIQDGMEEI